MVKVTSKNELYCRSTTGKSILKEMKDVVVDKTIDLKDTVKEKVIKETGSQFDILIGCSAEAK